MKRFRHIEVFAGHFVAHQLDLDTDLQLSLVSPINKMQKGVWLGGWGVVSNWYCAWSLGIDGLPTASKQREIFYKV